MKQEFEYVVTKESNQELTLEEHFNNLSDAADHCFNEAMAGDEEKFDILLSNSHGVIFKVNYCGDAEIDVENCATEDEISFLEMYCESNL